MTCPFATTLDTSEDSVKRENKNYFHFPKAFPREFSLKDMPCLVGLLAYELKTGKTLSDACLAGVRRRVHEQPPVDGIRTLDQLIGCCLAESDERHDISELMEVASFMEESRVDSFRKEGEGDHGEYKKRPSSIGEAPQRGSV